MYLFVWAGGGGVMLWVLLEIEEFSGFRGLAVQELSGFAVALWLRETRTHTHTHTICQIRKRSDTPTTYNLQPTTQNPKP